MSYKAFVCGNEVIMTDITPIIQAVLALIAALITVYVIPVLKAKMSDAQWNKMMAFVTHGVQAAEQLYQSGQGQQKKMYVMDYLESKGLSVDDAVIESTVRTLCGKSENTSSEFYEV